MKKWNRTKVSSSKNRVAGMLLAAGVAALAAGCGGEAPVTEADQTETESATVETEVVEDDGADTTETEETEGEDVSVLPETEESTDAETGEETAESSADSSSTGIANESAKDAEIDFNALRAENSEIFGWLHIPDTSIDAPILQSAESDDYYATHNAMKEADEGGALYIEAANLSSMCDFNTVIHGRTAEDGTSGIFADLYQFADPDFFDSHEQLYVYLDGNVLTYEVFAAFERENTSLLRTYDFTYLAGCNQFLEDVYNIREMNMMIRSGWEDVTPYHFLVTLTTSKGENPDKQFVVLAALINDPAGNIDRAVVE